MKKRNRIRIFTSVLILVGTIVSTLLNLYHSTKVSSACSIGGCAGCNGCSASAKPSITANNNYYIDKEKKLMNDLSDKIKVFQPVLKTYQTEKEIDKVIEETTSEFKNIIPQIPYIGGDANSLTEDLEQAAMVLAFYRVESRHGMTVDDVGTIVNIAIENELKKYPKWLLRATSAKYFTKKYINELKNAAIASQKRTYEGGWVFTFIAGDGKTFDYGYNYTECGIANFLNVQGASDLTPYLCNLDNLYSKYMDEGLTRTTTLGEGGPYCDFRFKRVRNVRLDIMIYGGIFIVGISFISLIAVILRFLYKRIWNNTHFLAKNN
jgi:hypothetical protein